jgi:hypothetical protein
MTEADKQLLFEFDRGIVDRNTFLKRFSVDIAHDSEYVRSEIKAAIKTADTGKIQMAISLISFSSNVSQFVDLLNELLINPNHRSHQKIAKMLQDNVPSPTTVPFIKKALETNFDYLDYTFSDSDVIAKWFSWLLYAIGTTEAIQLMKEYSNSKDEGIANEMRNRLNKTPQ